MDIENSNGCLSDLPSFSEILRKANRQKEDQPLLESFEFNSDLVYIKELAPDLQYVWNEHQRFHRMLRERGCLDKGSIDPVVYNYAQETFDDITEYLVEKFTALADGKKFDDYVVKTGWRLLGVLEESYDEIMSNRETLVFVRPPQKQLH